MSVVFRDPFFGSLLNSSADPMTRSSSNLTGGMKMDMAENDKEYVAHVDCPGVPKENIKISCEDDVLTIAAHFHKDKKKDTDRVHWEERSTGHVSRSIRLPEHVDVQGIKARTEHGVLHVTIPKLQQKEKPVHRINVE